MSPIKSYLVFQFGRVPKVDRVSVLFYTLAFLPVFLSVTLWCDPSRGDTVLSPAVEKLKTLVQMNSGTANQAGVLKVQNWLKQELATLGFEVSISAQNLLVGTKKGISAKTLTMVVHVDTVFETSAETQFFRLSEDGKKAFGPGVIDDKGSIVVLIESLRKFLAHESSPLTLQVISSPSEETGSPGLKDQLRESVAHSVMIVGFEPSLDNGSIVHSRRGTHWVDVKIAGKEAHAGRAFFDGANACVEASAKIVELSKLTNRARNVTVNIGHIEGGKNKFNVVCGNAEFKVDARFAERDDREKVISRIDKILSKTHVEGTQTTSSVEDDSFPFALSKHSRPTVQKLTEVLSQVEGRPVKAELSGGCADTNTFGDMDLILVDGMGATGGKMHTLEEFIELSSLETRSTAFAEFLKVVPKVLKP